MTKLLLKEEQNNRIKQSKGADFSTIIKLLGRIIKHNKLLFFECSLFALLTSVINFIAAVYSDKLLFNNLSEISSIGQVQIPYILGRSDKSIPLRKFILWLAAYLVFWKATFSIFHWYITTYSSAKIEKDLKVELFEILTKAAHERSSEISSKMLTQFSSDIETIAYNIWTIPNRLIYVIVSISLILFFKFRVGDVGQNKQRINYPLILVASLLFVSFFLIIFLLLKKSIEFGVKAKRRYEEDNRFVFERISNLEYIKSSSSEELERTKINDQLEGTLSKNRKSLVWTVLFRGIPDYLVSPNIPIVFLFIMTFDYFGARNTSASSFIAYFFAIRRLNGEVGKIFNSILTLEDLSGDLSLVMDSVNFLLEDNEPESKEDKSFVKGDILFDNITFAYPSRPENDIIEKLSFKFEKDKKYGIAGKNGIGKSTITKILLKLYKVSSGKVLIGKEELSSIKTKELHDNICRLNNRPSFFNMSIAENIFYPFSYNEKEDLKKLTFAAKQVKISAFIKSLPAGFDTVLREGGIDLSEGQKQQLEAMKFFIREYEIYIFDEILSNVHPLTRKGILTNIFTSIKDKLVIAIDHHYDIFTHMDYVYTFSSKKLTRVRRLEQILEESEQKDL